MTLFELIAKIKLDRSEYEDGLGDAEKKAEGFGGRLKNAMGGALKIIGGATVAFGAAVGAVTKKAVDSYAEFEQLTGGIETLYGSSAAAVEAMLKNADNAWKSAGLSANEYMETAIESSAALISSLGGDADKAAELMNMSIIDMADNVNKMGTTMESIQNAYRGFSRGNFTMLDNLALGYSGTREGMEQLMADAEALDSSFRAARDENGKLAMSYADIVNAVHIVQSNMKISGISAEEAAELIASGAMTQEEAYDLMGTTAKEAMTTISGSLHAMGSAWTNLVTGVADGGADLDALMNNFIESVNTALENLLPAIEQSVEGIGTVIEKIVPIISERLPGIIESVLPQLISAATSLTIGVVNALPTILSALLQSAPTIIGSLADAIIAVAPQLLLLGVQLIVMLAEGIVNGIVWVYNALGTLFSKVWEYLSGAIRDAVKSGGDFIQNLAKGIVGAASSVWTAIENIASNIWETISGVVGGAWTWGRDLIKNFIDGIAANVSALWDSVKNVAGGIASFLHFSVPEKGPLSDLDESPKDMMLLFANGIRDNAKLVEKQLNRSLDFDISPNIATGSGLYGGSGGIFGGGFGDVIININGANYSDENSLAEAIAQRLQLMVESRSMSLA